MQHAVDAEADDAEVAARLDMDVTCALLESVLPQPVDDGDDMLVIGVERAIAAPQFNQLFEIGRTGATDVATLGCAPHRLRQTVELDHVTRDIVRVGDDPTDRPAQNGRQLLFPLGHEGLGGGDHHLARRHLDRQDAEAVGVSAGHHFGHRGEIHLQRIDVEIVVAAPAGHPFGQRIQAERAMRRVQRTPLLPGQQRQRMIAAAPVAALMQEIPRHGLAEQAVGHHAIHQFLQGDLVFPCVLAGRKLFHPILHGAAQHASMGRRAPFSARL